MLTESEVVIRILTAIILGGCIGMERQFKQRPAGLKTHILVCVGSAAIMILSEYMFQKYYAAYGLMSDPLRLGAQVVSGVGFLGAGTIMHRGANVKGLTTAASLWVVAAIGLASGAGFYFLAVVVTVSISTVLFIFNKIYKGLRNVSDVTSLQFELLNKPKTIGAINILLAAHNIKILDMEFVDPSQQMETGDESEVIFLHLVLKMTPELSIYSLITQMEEINGIIKIERV